jgi:3-methyladenine DNA glycosylase AlkD
VTDELVAAIRSDLARAADPARAPRMQAYMKSSMPFRGVPMPVVRTTVRARLRDHPPADVVAWETAVRRLFDEAGYREERYAALAIAGRPRFRSYQTPERLALYRHLVFTGAWWDIVDDVSHRVGDVLLADRASVTPVMLDWSQDDCRWIRRCAILSQLGHKAATDTGLLGAVIDANCADSEFFIRKAIGWALREYARTDAEWVSAFVGQRRDRLSPLSVREALKHLPRPPEDER